MRLYSCSKNYKLYEGDMRDMLEVIEPNSIDAILTDPPYELGFMNCKWDNSGIAFQKETWRKCYDALKSGGHMLVFGGSRTFHRIACAIEDAGFEIRDTIMWIYGSGFPKSMDISKQIDKRSATSLSWFGNYLEQVLKDKNMSIKELAEKGGFYGEINHGGSVSNWIKGKNIPTVEQFNKICEILDLPFEKIEEAEREVIKQREKLESYQYKGNNVYQTNGNKEKIMLDITIPSTDLAKQWDGWGTALKPSFEPIIVARKPFKGSLVDNIIDNGVGGINIDECRIELNGDKKTRCGCKTREDNISHLKFRASQTNKEDNSCGRFPANTILTYDDSDFGEVCSGFPYTSSGKGKIIHKDFSKHNGSMMHNSTLNGEAGVFDNFYIAPSDSGSASRYFYCAKASKRDRDEGLEEFEEKLGIRSNAPRENETVKTKPRRNIHPTVKPTSLMQYLVRLVTPKGGTVLDPFNGSGSTGKACMYENADRNANYKYVGIELTEEYLPIAKARIEFAEKNPIMDYEIKKTKTETNKTDDKSKSIFEM